MKTEKQRVIEFLKKYMSGEIIDDEYEITQNVLNEILDNSNVQQDDKKFLEGIMKKKNLNNFLKKKIKKNDELRKGIDRSEIKAKIENHLKKNKLRINQWRI